MPPSHSKEVLALGIVEVAVLGRALKRDTEQMEMWLANRRFPTIAGVDELLQMQRDLLTRIESYVASHQRREGPK